MKILDGRLGHPSVNILLVEVHRTGISIHQREIDQMKGASRRRGEGCHLKKLGQSLSEMVSMSDFSKYYSYE